MKHLFWLCSFLLLIGCTESEIVENNVANKKEFYATIEGTDSRTYVDEKIRLRWTAEDCITIFDKTTYNREFMFTGKTGANAGGFTQKSVDDKFRYEVAVDNIYAVYPHSSDIQLDETDLFLTLDMPAEQTYVENSFGLGANTMVAVSETGQLYFKNVGSFLRILLYGEDVTVKSITLTSKGEEAIAGKAIVTPSMDGDPTCEMIGSTKSITLNCTTPVAISSDSENPTSFWIVVPPVTFAEGFTVTVTNSEDKTQVYDLNQSFTFGRNLYYDLEREVTLQSISNDEIWYTSSDGNVISLNATANFGANIVSNVYKNGKGIITFDSDIDIIGDYSFQNCRSLTSIVIPNSVTSIGNSAFKYCNYLVSITIPNSVTTIGNETFYSCFNLDNISIPDNVTTIGEKAFSGCEALTNITIPNSVTTIGEKAFYNCI